MANRREEINIIANNRRARHFYRIMERFEAGISLKGSEVKSCRDHNVNFKDSYATIKDEELYLYNLHIGAYKSTSNQKLNPTRERKLLVHKKDIRRLIGKIAQKGLTLVPLRLYFKGKWLKLEIALATGKQKFDKRQEIKLREHKEEIARAVRGKL